MLLQKSALAALPKARYIASLRLTREEYRSLMRRTSVLEVVGILQNHDYLKQTLGSLARTNIHREQLEQALSKDLFFKYESLMRYVYKKNHFGSYFLVRSEINELLAKLKLFNAGLPGQYILQMPGFLLEKTNLKLMEIAAAKDINTFCKLLSGTPYLQIVQSVLNKNGEIDDYLLCEHAFEVYYYNYVLQMIDLDLKGTQKENIKQLFLMQAEIFNLDMLFRIKAFYPQQFSEERIKKLLLPFYCVLNKKQLYNLADCANLQQFLQMYNFGKAANKYGKKYEDFKTMHTNEAQSVLYRKALRILRFTIVPEAALAALMCIAQIERSNIVSIVEGVRYKLEPEKIEQFLKLP